MSIDMSALGLKITSDGVVKATQELTAFAKAANAANAAAGKPIRAGAGKKQVAAESRQVSTALETEAQNHNRLAAVVERAAQRQIAANNRVRASMGGGGTAGDRGLAAAQTEAMKRASVDVDQYTKSLGRVPAAANAAGMAAKKAGNDAATGFARMRASSSNIAAQFQDIGVTAAMGMNPLMIALQQGTQLSAALAGGGLASLRAAFASVLSPVSLATIAIVAGAAALIQWGVSALSSSKDTDKLADAINSARISSYAFNDAQSALGGVIDLTTGKIKTQSSALIGLARAQLEVIRVTALKDSADAAKVLTAERGANRRNLGVLGPGSNARFAGLNTVAQYGPDVSQRIIDAIKRGAPTAQSIDALEKLRAAGKLTEDQFIKLTAATANLGVASENLKVYQRAAKALKGDSTALKEFLGPGSSASAIERQVALATATDAVAKATAHLNIVRERGRAAEKIADPVKREQALNQYRKDLTEATIAENKARDARDAATRASRASTKALNEQRREAEKLANQLERVRDTANADIATQAARAAAVGKAAEDAAYLEQRTKLLNMVDRTQLEQTPDLVKEIEGKARAYAKAKVSVDGLLAVENLLKNAERQTKALEDETKLIGLYGDALIRARNELRMLAEARAALPDGAKLSPDDELRIKGAAGGVSNIEIGNKQKQFLADLAKAADDAAHADKRLRGEIGLTGAALAVYRKETELLNQAQQRGIELTPEVVEGIKQTARAIGEAEYATQRLIEIQQRATDFTTDLFMGIVTGAKSAKQAVAELILELARMEAKKAFASLFSKAIGAFGGALGGGGPAVPVSWGDTSVLGGPADLSGLFANAKGGTYSGPGISAYSGSIVSRPTIFPFAKGVGLMGEAGAEAIMPLKRGPDGTLGVRAATNDNGRLHVSVSIDDNGNLRAMVRDEAGAVVAESAPQIVGQSVAATKRNYNKTKAGWR